MTKKLTILFILTGLSLVISGCVKNVKQPEVVNQNTNEQVATSTEEIDTSNWKTYRNEEYGFEFKYPEEWLYNIWQNDSPLVISFYLPDSDEYFDTKAFFVMIYKNIDFKDDLARFSSCKIEDYYNFNNLSGVLVNNLRPYQGYESGNPEGFGYNNFKNIIDCDFRDIKDFNGSINYFSVLVDSDNFYRFAFNKFNIRIIEDAIKSLEEF